MIVGSAVCDSLKLSEIDPLRHEVWCSPSRRSIHEPQPSTVFLGPQSQPQLSVKESKSKANYVFYLRFEAPFGPRSTFTPHVSGCWKVARAQEVNRTKVTFLEELYIP